MLEFALVLPLIVVLGLGVVEMGFALLDQHVITKLAREGANLISRDATLQQAAGVMANMSSRPVDFQNGAKVIFSVLKKGGTTGTSNFGQMILYQRFEYGSLPAVSTVTTQGSASFGPPPDYIAPNSDTNTNLRVTSLPSTLITVNGGMVYVAEVFTIHQLITPFDRFGINVPTTLYSVAYF